MCGSFFSPSLKRAVVPPPPSLDLLPKPLNDSKRPLIGNLDKPARASLTIRRSQRRQNATSAPSGGAGLNPQV